MIDLLSEKVKWFYDPTSSVHRYNYERVVEFLDYIRDCEINTIPSGRYYMLRERIVFWGGQHKFFFGVEHEHEAQALKEKWGGYYVKGSLIDGRFVEES